VTTWPEPVERVAEFLRRAAVESRLEQFPAGTLSAEDAARAVGCDLAQIVKSLVFQCDGRPVLVMIPGDRRADSAKVARVVPCERAKVAGPDAVRAATGFEPGAVAPFPLPGIETILVDQELLVHEVVWTGAGSHQHVAAIAPADLVRLTRARSVDVIAEDT
jgi:prolyl-tRNA editing enzyme YbaK/EbsC (Cys-tRNA(Pro) deacylase)